MPHRYQNGADDKKINVDTVQDNLIIKLSDIVTIHAKDVDLDYAVRDTFQTDTAISSRNGAFRNSEKKVLEMWDGSDSGTNGEMSNVSLELDSRANGWDANEMFQYNEKEHGIKTTFKDNLENYTVQIEKKDTQDFRKQELEAERIANEIENNPATKERLDLENGDEETAFAAVIRPSDEPAGSQQNASNNNNNNNNINDKSRSQLLVDGREGRSRIIFNFPLMFIFINFSSLLFHLPLCLSISLFLNSINNVFVCLFFSFLFLLVFLI